MNVDRAPQKTEVSASSLALQSKSELRYNYPWFAQHCDCQNLNEKIMLEKHFEENYIKESLKMRS